MERYRRPASALALAFAAAALVLAIVVVGNRVSDVVSLTALAPVAALLWWAGYRAGRWWPLTLLPVVAFGVAAYVDLQGAECSIDAAECSPDYPFGALIVGGGIWAACAAIGGWTAQDLDAPSRRRAA